MMMRQIAIYSIPVSCCMPRHMLYTCYTHVHVSTWTNIGVPVLVNIIRFQTSNVTSGRLRSVHVQGLENVITN